MKSYFGLVGAFLFALTADAAVPTLSSPANDACLATLKGSTTEEGSHKWFFYGKTAAERKELMNGGANATLRAKMGNTYGDHPKATTFSWSGTGPFTLTIKRRDGSVFLEKSGIAGTALSVDNFEIAASYTWTVSNADGASTPRAFTTEDTVPRLLNGSSQVDYTQGSVTTKVPHGVRDMGGYIGLDGRRARQGLLIRNSAFESDANDKGDGAGMKIKYIDDTNRPFWNEFIKVRTELDLRNNSESTLVQSTLGSGVTYKRFANLPAWKKYMTGTYASSFKKEVKGIFGYLADADKYPISFHCTHGKDRTGMLAFLIGSVLGYSESDIYADYEATIFWHPTQGVSLETSDTNGFLDYLNDSTASGVTGATIQEKAVNFIKSCGVAEIQLEAFREIMLEPIEEDEPDEPHTHTVENVPAVAATYATPGRTAGTRCSDCGEILSGCEAVPVLSSAITLSATVAADGQATVTFANVAAPVVLSVVYGNEDRGNAYCRDADWDGGTDPIGWDAWQIVGYLPAGSTSATYTIPNWGVDAADGRNGAKFARFILTPAELTMKCAYATATGTNPATQFIDTGIVPTGETTLNLAVTLGADPASKVLADTPSSRDGALTYGLSFDASKHPTFNYAGASYTVSTAVSTGNTVDFRANQVVSGKTGWKCKVNDSSKYATSQPSAKSTLTTDGTLHVYGLGTFGTFSIGGSTDAYFVPAVGFDVSGNELAGFFETKSGRMFASAGGEAFTLNEPSTNYRKDLMSNIPLVGETATIEYTAAPPTPPEPVVEPETPDGVDVYDYLQTDGKGYVLTDYTPNLKRTMIEFKLKLLDATVTHGLYVANACTKGDKSCESQMILVLQPGDGTVRYLNQATSDDKEAKMSGVEFDATEEHVVRTFGDTVWYDEQTARVVGYVETDEKVGGPLQLLAENFSSPNPVCQTFARVAYIKAWEIDGAVTNLVRKWVPAKTANGVATLYEVVNGRYETVSGSGAAFEVGMNGPARAVNAWTVAPSFEPLEYAAGTAPTFVIGESLYGTPVATYPAARLAKLDGGTYVQKVVVPATGEYTGLSTSFTFTVTGELPRTPTVAPGTLAPNGVTVALHTDKQKAFLSLPRDERRALYLDTLLRAQLAADGGEPKPVTLKWTGDGECTVTVVRAKDQKVVFATTLVDDTVDVWNLEINTVYTWSVVNALGTAKGTFRTEDKAPRLLRDPAPSADGAIRGIRDLGGRVGLDGRRVRQGRAFRCSQLNKEVSFVTDENRSFYLSELGIKTDLDFRSTGELYGIKSSPLGPSVAFVNAQIGSYTGLFGSTTAFKKMFDTFLDEANYPIVFHCAAGQDRTGVVAFLLNALLGVETEELDKDWEATAFWNGSVSFCHANLDKFYETLATKAQGGATVQEQAVNAVLNMGYTMADVEKFRSLMLEPAEEPAAMPAALVISEVCARCQPKAVPASKDLGWIEFYNGSNETVNLGDYKLLVLNRGKKIDVAKNILPLADCEIAPGGYALVYTSETFGNAAVAEVEDTFAGRGTITVYPKKINPKKYPFVQLFRGDELVQTVVVPVDLADEKSYTTVPERRILATPTPGAANGTEGVAYGPNVSSLYGVKDAPDPWRAFPKAQVGADYEVSFPVNPADMSTGAEDEIICVRLLYRIGFGETVEGPVMTKAAAADAMNGWVYTGTIPGAAFAKAGELVRFAALITDGKGRTWRSPSFCNPDDGYEWYGTIVAPGSAEGEGTESANLQTFHLFADPDEVADTPGEMNATALMNLDADDPGFTTEKHPYGARVGVYDSTTGLYYDHVRIDLRGHTSAGFVKKSHGLRFNKSQPLSCADPVTGTVVEEIRKSSFVSEYPDVSGVRQMLAFKIFNDNGSPAPFHYPVRLNLNGRFYQLAYHSERFSDELIEDCYGLDPLGYSYKNVGTFAAGNVLTITKKTPDDDHEDDLKVLKAFEATLKSPSSKTVVKSFDLSAWINYVALERITGERDGLCANTSAFYDVNGTDTWRPLAYDMNMSFGVYNTGIWQDDPAQKDWSKAKGLAPTAEHLHPFAGGLEIGDDGNQAVENVFQSAKFRRLYLRRLRTLMDKVLKAPDTALADTPAFQWAKDVADRIADDAALDRALWMDTADKIATGSANWVWGDRHTEAWTVAEGWADLWDNYVVPRRDYLFNVQTATPSGYAANLPAGIPAAQKPTAELKAGFAFANADVGTTLVISNGNAEAVDMSGWTLAGKVAWTIPAGTVIDANDVLTVVADRKAYVAAHEAELDEQVIVGNAAFDPSAASLVLADDAGLEVVEVGVPPTMDVGEATATPGTDFVGATVVLELGPQFSDHGNPVAATLAVNGGTVEGVVDLDAKTVTFEVESAERGETYAGEVTLTAGDEQLVRSVTLEQGRRTVVDASDGWIRVGETAVFDSQLVTPEKPAPETAVVTLKARLELGAGADEGTFDAADQVGVIAVETQEGNAYLFKTAEGVVTNVSASLELGVETEVEILADYAKRTVSYVVGGETNGPYALPAGALRASAVNLGGSGAVRYVNGDYEVMGLNTNLAVSGGAEYATVADAVAAGGPVTLLWDASWTPTEGGAYSFVSNGHELKIGGDMAFEVKRNDDGTLSVTVTGAVEQPQPTTITLKDGKVVIGVANPDPKRSYALARVEKLGEGDFVPDETTWKTGAELLSGASLEASVKPGATSEFFKVVVK